MTTKPLTGTLLASWLVLTLLVIAFLLLAIWPLGIASNLYDEKRMLVVTLLTVIALLLATIPPLRRLWQSCIDTIPSGISRLLLLILLFGLLSSWKSILPNAALAEIALWVLLFNLMIVIAALRTQLRHYFDYTIIGMLALIFIINLLVVSGYVLQSFAGLRVLDFRLLFVNFSHLRFFNEFQSWTLPLSVLPALYAQARGWMILRRLMVIAAINWWMLLYLSGGRGVLLALACSFIVVSVLFGKKVTQWLKLQILAALGGALLYLVLTQLVPEFIEVIRNPDLLRGSLSGRAELWQLAMTMIIDHPLLGVGPMHYACTTPALAGHPHNAVLQIAAEWGLPVSSLISGLLVWLLFHAIQRTRKRGVEPADIDIAPMLLASIFAAAILAQVSGVIVTPISQLTIALVGGWLWGMLVPAGNGVSTWRMPHILWSAAIAGSMVILMSVVSPLWQDAMSGTIAKPDLAREYKPRFWIDGEICRDGSFWRIRHEDKRLF